MADMIKQTHSEAHAQHGTARYWVVWAALLIATALTVWTGKINLGAANIYIAMAIATSKAALVVLFFMHLWDSGGVIRIVFVVSVVFLIVLLVGVFGDLMVRPRMTLPNMGPQQGTIQMQAPAQGH